MDESRLEHDVFVTLSSPQKNFATCHHGDIDCDDTADDFPADTGHHCSEEHLSKQSALAKAYFFGDGHESKARWVSGDENFTFACSPFGIHDVLRVVGHKVFIATSVTTIDQEKCKSLTKEKCIWKNKGIFTQNVLGIDDYKLKLRLSVRDPFDGKTYSNSNMQGFVRLENGTEMLIKCGDDKQNSDVCHIKSHYWRTYYGACGSGDMSESGCATTGWADFISLRSLMEFANVNLSQELAGGGNLTRRWWGTQLIMDVEYSNKDSYQYWGDVFTYEFWNDTLHSKDRTYMPLRYTISFRRVGDYDWDTEVIKLSDEEQQLAIRSGISLSLNTHGTMAHFSLGTLVVCITVASVALSLSQMFVDLILRQLYKRVPTTRHVYTLNEFFRYEESPHVDSLEGQSFENLHDFKEQASKEKAMQLAKETAEQRALLSHVTDQ